MKQKILKKNLIAKLETQKDEFGYNMSSGGDGVSGYKHTEETKEILRQKFYNMSNETREKMLDALRGRKLSDEHKQHISKGCMGTGVKKICQYELNGKFICIWNSMTDASKKLNIGAPDISSCCNNKRGQAGGYQFKFHIGNTNDISPYIVDMSRHKVIQKDSDNNIIKIWNSLNEIHKTLKYNTGNISSVCNGKREKAYGYKWEYI